MLDVGVRIFCDGCGSAGDCASCRLVGAIPGAKWVQCAEIVHMYRSTSARWRRVGGRSASRLAGDLRRNNRRTRRSAQGWATVGNQSTYDENKTTPILRRIERGGYCNSSFSLGAG